MTQAEHDAHHTTAVQSNQLQKEMDTGEVPAGKAEILHTHNHYRFRSEAFSCTHKCLVFAFRDIISFYRQLLSTMPSAQGRAYFVQETVEHKKRRHNKALLMALELCSNAFMRVSMQVLQWNKAK